MGLFDSVEFFCDTCGAAIEVQSKAWDCNLEVFPEHSVPTPVALDLHNQKVECPECGEKYLAKTPARETVKVTLVKTHPGACKCGGELERMSWEDDSRTYCNSCSDPYLRDLLTKDAWIQKTKALLFDMQFCCDSKQLLKEIKEAIKDGGGYNPALESSIDSLNWGKTDNTGEN